MLIFNVFWFFCHQKWGLLEKLTSLYLVVMLVGKRIKFKSGCGTLTYFNLTLALGVVGQS